MKHSKIASLFDQSSWKFARTMAYIPHHYTKKETWKDKEAFMWAVGYIREHGVDEYFGKRKFRYLYLGEYKYWTMGEPIEKTILINRAKA